MAVTPIQIIKIKTEYLETELKSSKLLYSIIKEMKVHLKIMNFNLTSFC